MHQRRLIGAPLLLAALGSLVVGCSGSSSEGKEYQVPKALCGISVDPELLSPLLPPGEKVGIREKTPVPNRNRCQVLVDGKLALVASEEWWERGDSMTTVARGVPQLKSVRWDGGSPSLHSGTGALARVDNCASADHPGHTLYTVVQVYAKDVGNATAVKKLSAAYTEAVENGPDCR
ncbi:hypothetical protein [Streptomyces sp. NPDC003697]